MKLKIILNNLTFENIFFYSHEQLEKIREIRNEDNIRKNSANKNKISSTEHLSWFKKIKISETNNFYAIKYNNNIVGGLALNKYDKNRLIGEWSFYISEKTKFIGLGASIEYKAIEYFFNYYNLDLLLCYVLKYNLSVLKLHNKFGFEEILFDKYFQNNNIKNKVSDSVYLSLKKCKWDLVKKKIYEFYFS
jgi:UDP-4-amino-4,6-dideoxy-N-acetyl-beta-L-altrosamine N-acetyltransferase